MTPTIDHVFLEETSTKRLTQQYANNIAEFVGCHQTAKALAAAIARRECESIPLNDLQKQLIRNYEAVLRAAQLWRSSYLHESNRITAV